MASNTIRVRGARTHNLQNIDLDIPRDQFIVLTGLSGSGKTSLALDTLYAEGQRRYVESLSAYARQFLSVMEKPDVDHIEGLSPAIAIEQKSTSHNPRSTVGTVTEIHDYLRLLFARIGEPYCPHHHISLQAQTVAQMVDTAMKMPNDVRWMLLAPVVQDRKGEHLHMIDQLRSEGFVRVRIDGIVVDIDDVPPLDKNKKHSIEVVVDRFKTNKSIRQRLTESFEVALNKGDGIAIIHSLHDEQHIVFSSRYACAQCGYSMGKLEPKMFSFNSPLGACAECDGLGVRQFFDPSNIVVSPEMPLSHGAILSWNIHVPYYYQMLKSLANHYQFDLDTPFQQLSTKIRDVILYGSGDEVIEMRYVSEERRSSYYKRHSFEGVIPNLQRRWRDTGSSAVRDELTKLMSTDRCPDCEGARLSLGSRHVFIQGNNLPSITALPINKAFEYFSTLKLQGQQAHIAERILRELQLRTQFLCNVGLEYLTLERSAETLSGGEAQRIRLASQIGAGLVGVMYILDEPSIGLHQRDNQRLLNSLLTLRDMGNTLLVVEHDEDTIRAADYVIDMGPGAGVHGGTAVACGTPQQIASNGKSLTGRYLNGTENIPTPIKRKKARKDYWLALYGACGNNLNNVDLKLPLGLMTCITGVSGSGKSTLTNGTLFPYLNQKLNGAGAQRTLKFDHLTGAEKLDKCININQAPIGRTPRSNPATYTGMFTAIREIFASVPEARMRGYAAGRFSFNVRGGRCEACQGNGLIKVEMHFLADVYVKCDTCQGQRYNRETLEILYKQKNIYDVLEMTVEDGRQFFAPVPAIKKKLDTLHSVGLDYIRLGQQATTLSGGEAQRIKLSKELARHNTGHTLYILDEPTTGLHFHDIRQLLTVLHRLRDLGNTVVVIEHNLEVIKTADWVIDLGPDGGDNGGTIVAQGPPEKITTQKNSYTGQFLRNILHP